MNFIAAGEFKFVEGENETIKSASQKIAGEFLVFALMRQMLSQYCLLDSPSPCTHNKQQHLNLIFDKISEIIFERMRV